MAKKKYPKILKNKVVVIFIIAVLLVGFTLFVRKMVDNVVPGEVKVKLETSEGDIVIKLYSDMPITAGNFKSLVGAGTYDGVIFHRVIAGFMIQGGDPTGTGMGDPNIPTIRDEFVKGHSNVRGTISMANTGAPNSGGSQFFINLDDNEYLDWDKQPLANKHPVFGEVIEGMDVVDKIGKVAVDGSARPLSEVKIIKATVI